MEYRFPISFKNHRKRFQTNRSLRAHCKNQSQNRCKVCFREFCMATELSAHACETPTTNQSISTVQCDTISSKTRLNNRAPAEQVISVVAESSARIEKQSSKRIQMPGKTSKKPFKCEECGRRFKANSNLLIHRSHHIGVRPFECWLCHKK